MTPRNPVARWASRARWWQLAPFLAVIYGGVNWALNPHQTFVGPVVGGLVFGLVMAWVFEALRRRDRAATGVSTSEVVELDRAIARGVVPDDPRQRAAMVNLIERRRRQLRGQRVLGPIGITLLLALGVVVTITMGLWPNVVFVIVLAAFDVLAVIEPARQLRKLDQMTALIRHQP